MPRTILVTGGSGFVGQIFLPLIANEKEWIIRVLVRHPKPVTGVLFGADIVVGDLADPASYKRALTGVDTVIHLGALTGKASAAQHHRVNNTATQDLIKECEDAGVTEFLFVSSIAAGYKDTLFYPYAKSKIAAESALSTDGSRPAKSQIAPGIGVPSIGLLQRLLAWL